MGRPHRRAHRPRVPEPGRHRRPPRQDPQRPARPASTTASTSTARRPSASRPAGWPSPWSTTSSRPTTRTSSSTSRRELERPHPARRAPGLRAVHPGPHRRGGQPRHPVHPPRPPLARPVRARRPPAAHPGDDDLQDERHRRRHRVGQEPDQSTPRQRRPARPASRTLVETEDGAVAAARRIGYPCVHQAARRQPRPRRPPGPARRGRGPGGVPGRPGPEPQRRHRGRELRRTATTIAAWSSAARSRPSPNACRPA